MLCFIVYCVNKNIKTAYTPAVTYLSRLIRNTNPDFLMTGHTGELVCCLVVLIIVKQLCCNGIKASNSFMYVLNVLSKCLNNSAVWLTTEWSL